MADTEMIALTDTAWTEIAEATNGYTTNEGTVPVKYVEAAVAPLSLGIGHTLEASSMYRNIANYRYSLNTGQKVFMHSISSAGLIAKTGD